jgi:hypothetical protein
MTNYIWKIDSIMSHEEMFGERDVIFAINFKIIASDDSGVFNVISATTGVTYDAESSYTPYSLITEECLLEWVFDSLSEEAKSELQQRAGSRIPNVVTRTL